MAPWQFFETEGRVFVDYGNKKTDIQISEIPGAFLDALHAQRDAHAVKPGALEPPALEPHLGEDGGGAVELWADFAEAKPDMALIDSRNANGVGFAIYVGPEAQLVVELRDREDSVQRFRSAAGALRGAGLRHVVVSLDGAADVATIVIDGRLSGANEISGPTREGGSFAELSHDLDDLRSGAPLRIGLPMSTARTPQKPFSGRIERVRTWPAPLLTSEAISLLRAGVSK